MRHCVFMPAHVIFFCFVSLNRSVQCLRECFKHNCAPTFLWVFHGYWRYGLSACWKPSSSWFRDARYRFQLFWCCKGWYRVGKDETQVVCRRHHQANMNALRSLTPFSSQCPVVLMGAALCYVSVPRTCSRVALYVLYIQYWCVIDVHLW